MNTHQEFDNLRRQVARLEGLVRLTDQALRATEELSRRQQLLIANLEAQLAEQQTSLPWPLSLFQTGNQK